MANYGGSNRVRFRYVGLTTSVAQTIDDQTGTVIPTSAPAGEGSASSTGPGPVPTSATTARTPTTTPSGPRARPGRSARPSATTRGASSPPRPGHPCPTSGSRAAGTTRRPASPGSSGTSAPAGPASASSTGPARYNIRYNGRIARLDTVATARLIAAVHWNLPKGQFRDARETPSRYQSWAGIRETGGRHGRSTGRAAAVTGE